MASSNIGAAALAIVHAFLLHGGPGPAIATANALGAIVEAVGCYNGITQSLQSVLNIYKTWDSTQDIVLGYIGRSFSCMERACGHAGTHTQFSFLDNKIFTLLPAVGQNKYLAGCWTTLNDAVAENSLTKVQPLISTRCTTSNSNASAFIPSKICVLCKEITCWKGMLLAIVSGAVIRVNSKLQAYP